ncbi:hypothetical protein J5X84_00245 [Streptosporangiaceae bacterium NEAU-GS5]|nr:hypothetical protein [Streptosporangiaceae bacterium NEAU-GS5]
MRSHFGNRIGIGIVGLFMLVAGCYAFFMRASDPQILVVDLSYVTGSAWALLLAVAVTVTLALVVTRWLLRALGWGRGGVRTGSGTAMLGVLLKGTADIHRMRVRVVGAERIRVSVICGPGTDLAGVVRRLDPGGASRLRRAVDVGPDPGGTPIVVRLGVRAS